MPTYAYACTACDHRFEAQQSFSDDALTECPECSGRLRKLFNSVGIVFKGSGFYKTDSRNGSSSSSGDASGTKTESASSATPKTETTKSESSGTTSSAAAASSSTSSATSSASSGSTSAA